MGLRRRQHRHTRKERCFRLPSHYRLHIDADYRHTHAARRQHAEKATL